jgi:hypothetical protein
MRPHFKIARPKVTIAVTGLTIFGLSVAGAYAASGYQSNHQGAQRHVAHTHTVTSDDVHKLAPGYYTLTSTARCPNGERALGGGFFHSRGLYQARGASVAGYTSVWYSGPAANGTAWSVSADVYTDGGRYELQAFATCARPS